MFTNNTCGVQQLEKRLNSPCQYKQMTQKPLYAFMLLTSAPNETVSACRMFIRSPTFKIDLSSFMHFQRVVSVHPWKSACSDATKAMMTSLGNTHTHTNHRIKRIWRQNQDTRKSIQMFFYIVFPLILLASTFLKLVMQQKYLQSTVLYKFFSFLLNMFLTLWIAPVGAVNSSGSSV